MFPFRYLGIVYNKCSDVTGVTGVDNNQAWCSTEVTTGGEHVEGKAAVCPNTCTGAEANSATSSTTITTTTTTPTTTTTTTGSSSSSSTTTTSTTTTTTTTTT